VIYKANKPVRMANSAVLYFNHFYNKYQHFKFNTKLVTVKTASIEDQNNQCQLCYKKFSFLLGIPCGVYWCSYFLKFVCKDCISHDYSIIPSFVLMHWNFNKFPVSKRAKEILNKWHSKHVINIKNNDRILNQSYLLREAIAVKRKIHKMFDLMACEDAEEVVITLLKKDSYLVLKQNLFSLKDLCEINDGKMIEKLNVYKDKLQTHLRKTCKVCNYKGGTCKICLNNEIIYAYDVEDIFYCHDCKNIFHRTCCSVHPCVINR